jgi:hypothetical protein
MFMHLSSGPLAHVELPLICPPDLISNVHPLLIITSCSALVNVRLADKVVRPEPLSIMLPGTFWLVVQAQLSEQVTAQLPEVGAVHVLEFTCSVAVASAYWLLYVVLAFIV